MTRGDRSRIELAIRDIVVNDRVDEGVAAICRVAGIPVPARRAPREPLPPRPTGKAVTKARGPQVKVYRIQDPWAIAVYLMTHEWCENGCGKPATVVHHLDPAGGGGDDIPENFAALCGGKYNRDGTLALPDPDNCHTGNNGFHTLGGMRWFKKFWHRWEPAFIEKVKAVLRI